MINPNIRFITAPRTPAADEAPQIGWHPKSAGARMTATARSWPWNVNAATAADP
jgi:hypothetical protein